ncbi:hypothetical protein P7C70_g6285, partial [Phenoliferia sp. Uapishka_3]
MNKALARPATEYVPSSLTIPLHPLPARALNTSILYYKGDLQSQKAGALRFSAPSARDAFALSVRDSIRPPQVVRDLAEICVKKMRRKVNGRGWMAVHFSTGDVYGSSNNRSTSPLAMMAASLEEGRSVIAAHYGQERIPRPADPFFLATNERNKRFLAQYREAGAVFLADLLNDVDITKMLGPSASFTEIRILVEQVILSRSDWFAGSRSSLVTGGAINLRMQSEEQEWSWSVIGPKTE